MERIKQKIQALTEDVNEKEDRICDLEKALKERNEEIHSLEEDNKSLANKVSLLEEKFDSMEELCVETKKELDRVNAEKEESTRSLQYLTNSEANSAIMLDKLIIESEQYKNEREEMDHRFDELEEQTDKLKEAQEAAVNSDYKFEEVQRKHQYLEQEFGAAEEKIDKLSNEKADMAQEILQMGEQLQALKAIENKFLNYEDTSEDKISCLTSQLDELTRKTEEQETELRRVNSLLEQAEDKADQEKLKSEKTQAELDSLYLEFDNM